MPQSASHDSPLDRRVDVVSWSCDWPDGRGRQGLRDLRALRWGIGSNIELFSYQSPDQKVVQPKNTDIGRYYIAFYVNDIEAAANCLHARDSLDTEGPV
jgi:hypothetical protein